MHTEVTALSIIIVVLKQNHHITLYKSTKFVVLILYSLCVFNRNSVAVKLLLKCNICLESLQIVSGKNTEVILIKFSLLPNILWVLSNFNDYRSSLFRLLLIELTNMLRGNDKQTNNSNLCFEFRMVEIFITDEC